MGYVTGTWTHGYERMNDWTNKWFCRVMLCDVMCIQPTVPDYCYTVGKSKATRLSGKKPVDHCLVLLRLASLRMRDSLGGFAGQSWHLFFSFCCFNATGLGMLWGRWVSVRTSFFSSSKTNPTTTTRARSQPQPQYFLVALTQLGTGCSRQGLGPSPYPDVP